MHNLEGILFEEVTDDKGVSYANFRKTLQPDFFKTWVHITGGILAIGLLCLLSWYGESLFSRLFWLTIPVFSILLGFSIAYVNLFVHEAGHYYIHPHKKTNDILANIVLCSWTGIDIKAYRKIHWQHHLRLATPADTENSYFHPLSLSFILETLTGMHLLRVITNKSSKQFLGSDLARRSSYMLLAGLAINFSILLVAVYFNHWQFAITWTMGMVIFFPFFAAIRQISEHRDEQAGKEPAYYAAPRNKISRLFSDSLLSRLFGAAGFNKHMIHHWDPLLPFTALSKAEQFLSGCPRTRDIILASRTTYFSVFKKLLFPR